MSHEEALGGQAIRENAAEYNALMARYFAAATGSARAPADSAARARPRGRARANLQKTRENYHMLDDEFQLPVLDGPLPRRFRGARRAQARLPARAPERRDAAGAPAPGAGARSRSRPGRTPAIRAEQPGELRPKRDSTHWRSASWRDSDAGYAGGRFAMDINAIWAPRALESIAGLLRTFHALGFTEPGSWIRRP